MKAKPQPAPDAPDAKNVASLIAKLGSPDPLVRVRALQDLAEMREKANAAIPRIAALLSDEESFFAHSAAPNPSSVGQVAAGALQNIGSSGIAALIAAVKNGSVVAKRNAIQQLAVWNISQKNPLDLALWPVFLGALQHPDDLVSFRGAEILLEWLRSRTTYESAPDGFGMQAYVKAMPIPIEPFLKVLSDKRPFVRSTILEFIGGINDPKNREAIFAALDDPDEDVQETAIKLIAVDNADYLFHPRSLEPLLQAVRSDFAGGEYVYRAVYSLRKYRDPRVVDALIIVLETSEKPEEKFAAMEVLGQLKATKAVDALIKAMQVQPSGYVTDMAAVALGEVGDKRALPALAAYCATLKNPYSGAPIALKKLKGEDPDAPEKAR